MGVHGGSRDRGKSRELTPTQQAISDIDAACDGYIDLADESILPKLQHIAETNELIWNKIDATLVDSKSAWRKCTFNLPFPCP